MTVRTSHADNDELPSLLSKAGALLPCSGHALSFPSAPSWDALGAGLLPPVGDVLPAPPTPDRVGARTLVGAEAAAINHPLGTSPRLQGKYRTVRHVVSLLCPV